MDEPARAEISSLTGEAQRKSRLWWSLAAFLFAGLCLFVRLGGWALINPDEGRNASVALEMKTSGAWLVPTYDGLAYLDKPAFLFSRGRVVIFSLRQIGSGGAVSFGLIRFRVAGGGVFFLPPRIRLAHRGARRGDSGRDTDVRLLLADGDFRYGAHAGRLLRDFRRLSRGNDFRARAAHLVRGGRVCRRHGDVDQGPRRLSRSVSGSFGIRHRRTPPRRVAKDLLAC